MYVFMILDLRKPNPSCFHFVLVNKTEYLNKEFEETEMMIFIASNKEEYLGHRTKEIKLMTAVVAGA